MSANVLQAVIVTAELCGTTLTPAAATVFVEDLMAYPEPAVLDALRRCRREVKGRLSIADVISRIDDGRPGPEEAWAMVPKDEHEFGVLTDEMAHALGAASPLLEQGDKVAARMAFKEAYTAAVSEARDASRPARWFASLGWDRAKRDAALVEAVERGRLTASHARTLSPQLALPAGTAPQLEADDPKILRLFAGMAGGMALPPKGEGDDEDAA